MLTVYNCVVTAHDLRLVALAAVVCSIASVAAITLLHHVRRSEGRTRLIWLAVSATATGFGIFATHFIAMLAFSPGLPSGYNIGLTVLSLASAVAITAVGLGLAVLRRLPGGAWLGGAAVGGGIATMHYTGMAAFEVEGLLVWDFALVAASIALGACIGAASLPVGLRNSSLRAKADGACLLTAAICSHHFTAMGAVSIIPDPSIAVSPSALPTSWLAIAVAVASFAIVLLSLAGVALDIRDRRRVALEADRIRGLANAAVEGLLVCKADTIVTANNSFAALSGYGENRGLALGNFFSAATRLKLFAQPEEAVEAELRRVDGAVIPVELILRLVDFGGTPHQAIAVRDLRARKKAEQHIRFLAHHDPLTALPNRSAFGKKLDIEIGAAASTGQCVAVLCLDLDRFKEVNDLFGHATGDAVLQTVARRVGAALEQGQMLARLGGDEFAVIAPGLTEPTAAGRIAETILEALSDRSPNSPEETALSTSIGIAVYPHDATNPQELLGHADTALYRAKLEGRGTYRFFEAAMAAQLRDRRHLEHELRQAVQRDELSLVYQPQKDIKSGEIVGFEALLRWRHPKRGDVSPSIFIPVAEESGAILAIGEWVLRTACREAANWPRALGIAVNVSAVQLHQANFARLLHEVLLETGLPGQRLELEITETALIRDLNRALATLRQVKSFGVRIAMDDFGTGYSSLSNLRAFPFDRIKIDGSFVKSVEKNEQTATIVRAILGLGRGLGLPVLAEGVETSAQLEFLRSADCDEGQGYHLGRPAEIGAFREITHGSDQAPITDTERSRTASVGTARDPEARGAVAA